MLALRHTHTHTHKTAVTCETSHQYTVHYTCHWHTNTYRFQSLLRHMFSHTAVATTASVLKFTHWVHNLYMYTHNACIHCMRAALVLPFLCMRLCGCLLRVCVCVCLCLCACSLHSETLHRREIGINTFCSVICHIFTRLKPSEHQSILLWRHLSNCPTLQRHTHTHAHTHTHTRMHTRTHTQTCSKHTRSCKRFGHN